MLYNLILNMPANRLVPPMAKYDEIIRARPAFQTLSAVLQNLRRTLNLAARIWQSHEKRGAFIGR